MQIISHNQLKKEKRKIIKEERLKEKELLATTKPILVTECIDDSVDGCGIILLKKINNDIFLLLRFCNDLYYIPKGHRKINETTKEAAIRELYMYTTISDDCYSLIDNPYIIKYHAYYHNKGHRIRGHYLNKSMHIYFAVLANLFYEISIKTNEYGSYHWINHNKIEKNQCEQNLKIFDRNYIETTIFNAIK